jgi:hypothetical protein
MVARIAENPEGHGLHRYDLDSFGLSRDIILNRFQRYIDQYGIKIGS